ncbi:MAG TPA: hypothetical protein VLY83_06790 [Methanoregula sp.]|nr:hypothetical protein [Methanoregula sp.]
MKAKKIRNVLSEKNISRFDRMNDSNLLDTIHVDSGGKIFVSFDFHDGCLQGICRVVNDFAAK